jgi:hypothetical protein
VRRKHWPSRTTHSSDTASRTRTPSSIRTTTTTGSSQELLPVRNLLPQHHTPHLQLLLQLVHPFLPLHLHLTRQQLIMSPPLHTTLLANVRIVQFIPTRRTSISSSIVNCVGKSTRLSQGGANLAQFLSPLLEFGEEGLNFQRRIVGVASSSDEGVEGG